MSSQFGTRKPDFLKSSYLAIELTDESRARLLANVAPLYDKVIAHHVTIAFTPTTQDLNRFPVDELIKMTVNSDGDDEKAQCVRVTLHSRHGKLTQRPDGAHYHVTISVSPTGKPKDSNGIPDRRFQFLLCPFELTGIVKLLPK